MTSRYPLPFSGRKGITTRDFEENVKETALRFTTSFRFTTRDFEENVKETALRFLGLIVKSQLISPFFGHFTISRDHAIQQTPD